MEDCYQADKHEESPDNNHGQQVTKTRNDSSTSTGSSHFPLSVRIPSCSLHIMYLPITAEQCWAVRLKMAPPRRKATTPKDNNGDISAPADQFILSSLFWYIVIPSLLVLFWVSKSIVAIFLHVQKYASLLQFYFLYARPNFVEFCSVFIFQTWIAAIFVTWPPRWSAALSDIQPPWSFKNRVS